MSLIQDLFKRLSGSARETSDQPLAHDELQLASAALLVHAAQADGNFTADEIGQIRSLLKGRFSMSDPDCDALMIAGEAEDDNAVDLYGFTSVLKRHLDQDGRINMVRMLWQTVYADRELTEFEDNVVWRVAELLGVSTRDRITLKKEVQGGLGDGPVY